MEFKFLLILFNFFSTRKIEKFNLDIIRKPIKYSLKIFHEDNIYSPCFWDIVVWIKPGKMTHTVGDREQNGHIFSEKKNVWPLLEKTLP